MNSGELLVSTEALIFLFVFLMYLPVGVISFLAIFPRLSPTSRHLASAFLAAQVLVILLSLGLQRSSSPEAYLWALNWEGNIPSILASAQLALVGGVALATARLAKTQPTWQRLYLVGLGLVFLYLAVDEYYTVHESIRNWERYYAALGAVVVAATVLVALHSSRRSWIWHVCLLTGLAMSASGALVIEQYRAEMICWSWGFLRLNKCLQFYHFEETLEFLGIWIVLVAMLGQFTDAASRPRRRVRRTLYALPVFWILMLFLVLFFDIYELRLLAQPAAIEFESRVHLYGYRIDSGDSGSVLRLYPSVRRRDYFNLGYSVHLVDQVSGNSVASRNQNADRRVESLHFSSYRDIYRQQIVVQFPPQAPANRALWVVLTLWREKDGDYVLQKILASDHRLLSDTQVILDELIIPSRSASSSADALAVFDNGFALDAVDLPEYARAGETLTIPVSWRSDVRGREDHVQFLHFGHEESGTWWVYDQQPLGSRLPTRLWYSGLADSEIWQVPLPADMAPGRYTVFTGLYRTRDLERLPASDADGTSWLDARVPLGFIMVEG